MMDGILNVFVWITKWSTKSDNPSAIRLRNIWASLTFVRPINRYFPTIVTYWSYLLEYSEMSPFQPQCPLEVLYTLSVVPTKHSSVSPICCTYTQPRTQQLRRCPDQVATSVTDASQVFQKVDSAGWSVSPSTSSHSSAHQQWWLLLQHWLS